MFTHQIHQQYSNCTDSRQILKEIELFKTHGLKFYRDFCDAICLLPVDSISDHMATNASGANGTTFQPDHTQLAWT